MDAREETVALSRPEADALAAELLGGLRTRLGEPHIVHARRVASGAAAEGDERVVVAALLHDVVEKGQIGLAELRAKVGGPVADLVDILTHRVGEPDEEYLARCAADPSALLIKRLDLEDKLVADGSSVPASVTRRLRRQASERLALLDRLARPVIG